MFWSRNFLREESWVSSAWGFDLQRAFVISWMVTEKDGVVRREKELAGLVYSSSGSSFWSDRPTEHSETFRDSESWIFTFWSMFPFSILVMRM